MTSLKFSSSINLNIMFCWRRKLTWRHLATSKTLFFLRSFLICLDVIYFSLWFSYIPGLPGFGLFEDLIPKNTTTLQHIMSKTFKFALQHNHNQCFVHYVNYYNKTKKNIEFQLKIGFCIRWSLRISHMARVMVNPIFFDCKSNQSSNIHMTFTLTSLAWFGL